MMTATGPERAEELQLVNRVALRCAQVLLVLLPVLVALAIYLPGGLVMPSRVVIVLLAVVVWLWPGGRAATTPGVRHVVLGAATVSACLILFGGIGWIRFPEGVIPAHAGIVGFAVLLILTSGKLGGWPTTVRVAVIGWVLSLLVTGVVGTWEVLTGGYLPGNTPAVYFKPSYPDYDLIASTFDNPNLYAYHIVVGVLALPVLWPRRGWLLRGLLVLFGAWQILLLWYTGSRLCLLTLILGVSCWMLFHRGSRLLVLAGAGVVAVGSLLKVPWLAPVWGFVDWSRVDLEGSSEWVRMLLLRSAVWSWQRTDLLGAGPGGFEHWALHPDNPYQFEGLNNAHAGMAELLVEYGVVSFVVTLAALLVAGVAAWRWSRRTRGQGRVLGRAVVVMVVCFIPCSSMHSTWLNQPMMGLHSALMVLLLAGTAASLGSLDRGAGEDDEHRQPPPEGDAELLEKVGVEEEGDGGRKRCGGEDQGEQVLADGEHPHHDEPSYDQKRQEPQQT